jgi:PAS domain S-box-containing protein
MVSNANKAKKSNYYTKMNQPARSEFEQLAESSNDAIRIINKDFTIRYINRAFAEMTGINQNDVIGKKCWEVFPSVLCHTPECRASRVLGSEKRIEVEIERQKHDGTVIPCVVTTFPLKNNAGDINGIIEQFRDITVIRHKDKEIKESEDRYRALIELGTEAGEAIVMLQDIEGKEGIQTFVSDQWPYITGYTREELLGHSFFDMLMGKDRQASIKRHRVKMSGEACPGLFEMTIIRKNRTEIPIEITGAYTTYLGKPANVLYIRDITKRKQLEKEITDDKEKYESLFEHTPIGTVESNASQLKKYFDDLRKQVVSDFEKYFNTDDKTIWYCLQ